MADTVRKLLKKIRNVPKEAPKPEPLWKKYRALHEARLYADEFWERDKERVRDVAFQKAQLKLEEYRAERRAEKERQEQIAQERLDNLKKARRKLKRMRQTEGE